MYTKKIALLGLVTLATLAGCAAQTGDEEVSGSEDALRDEPVGFCRADGFLRKEPSASAPMTAGVNPETKLNVFCKVQTQGEGVWVAANIRSAFSKSYLWSGALQSCEGRTGNAIAPADFVASLPACPAPSAGGAADAGSSTPAQPVVAKAPPSDAAKTKPMTFRPRTGHFNEPIWVGRTGNGTFTMGAVWNAYDAAGTLKGSGTCPEGTWAHDYVGSYDCYGSSAGAARFDVVYYARGAAAAKASF
ncbi:MAG: hypothetical protein KC657_05955 [Myxococcales bacterium]|nr:hypothetical protein [Myxococcales bacterium]